MWKRQQPSSSSSSDKEVEGSSVDDGGEDDGRLNGEDKDGTKIPTTLMEDYSDRKEDNSNNPITNPKDKKKLTMGEDEDDDENNRNENEELHSPLDTNYFNYNNKLNIKCKNKQFITIFITILNEHLNNLQYYKNTLQSLQLQNFKCFEIYSFCKFCNLKNVISLQKEPNTNEDDNNLNLLLNYLNKNNKILKESNFILFLNSGDLLKYNFLEMTIFSLTSYSKFNFHFINSYYIKYNDLNSLQYTLQNNNLQIIKNEYFNNKLNFLHANKINDYSFLMINKFIFLKYLNLLIKEFKIKYFYEMILIISGNEKCWGLTLKEILIWINKENNIIINSLNNNYYNLFISNFRQLPNWKYSISTKFNYLFPYQYYLNQENNVTINIKFEKFNSLQKNLQNTQENTLQNGLQNTQENILFLVPWLALGGADRFNLNLIKGLQKNKNIYIITTHYMTNNNVWKNKFKKYCKEILFLDLFIYYYDYPLFLTYFIKSRKIKYVIISNSEPSYKILPFLKLNCKETLFLDYLHMEQEEWRDGGYPRHSMMMLPYLDNTIFNSKHLLNYYLNKRNLYKLNNLQNNNLPICYVNVDTKKFKKNLQKRKELRLQYGITNNDFVILFVGRFTEQKQPKVFINVLKHLIYKFNSKNNNNLKKIYAFICGEGEDRNLFENERSEYFIVNDKNGILPNEMINYYSMSDIIFLPSKMEGIAFTLFEALSTENIFIGANVGGQSEIILQQDSNLQKNLKDNNLQEKKDIVKDEQFAYLIKPINEEQDTLKYINIFENFILNKNLKKINEIAKLGREHVIKYFDNELMIECVDKVMKETKRKKVKSPEIALELTIRGLNEYHADT
ncbi:hypothetical protein ABK040_014304 [Willaertia magna]